MQFSILYPLNFCVKANSEMLNYVLNISTIMQAKLSIMLSMKQKIILEQQAQFKFINNDCISFIVIKKVQYFDILEALQQHTYDLLILNNQTKKWWQFLASKAKVETIIDKISTCPILILPKNGILLPVTCIAYATTLQTPVSVLQRLNNLANVFNATLNFVHIIVEETRSFSNQMQQFKNTLQQCITQPYKVIEIKNMEVGDSLLAYCEQNSISILGVFNAQSNDLQGILVKSIAKQLYQQSKNPVLIIYA